ncbi:DUF3727 domain-containing protein [Roseofilum casamattae]|uniref:DUF3727 domain-containing protein n=1 Tax=Roseofilum casamattae BLCC-M143 TaxID=3022442 RepID=A0ABT7BX18_9CYAN|nr:DUF3727 domain-containing protein [Roseofilum casamattae]MDJ1183731.1 DUF3727 domain-containing protein [Roseofilum casamattae BLCC-M143]
MDSEIVEEEMPIVFLKDTESRELPCSVEHSFTHEGHNYLVLLPKDTPVEILAWDGEGDEEELIPIEEAGEIDRLFDLARAVLGEQNLTLNRTDISLTVTGELPELLEQYDESEDGLEAYQSLANFCFGEDEYEISMPLNPLFLLARITSSGEATVLSDEEVEAIEHLLPKIEAELKEHFLNPVQ